MRPTLAARLFWVLVYALASVLDLAATWAKEHAAKRIKGEDPTAPTPPAP